MPVNLFLVLPELLPVTECHFTKSAAERLFASVHHPMSPQRGLGIGGVVTEVTLVFLALTNDDVI